MLIQRYQIPQPQRLLKEMRLHVFRDYLVALSDKPVIKHYLPAILYRMNKNRDAFSPFGPMMLRDDETPV